MTDALQAGRKFPATPRGLGSLANIHEAAHVAPKLDDV